MAPEGPLRESPCSDVAEPRDQFGSGQPRRQRPKRPRDESIHRHASTSCRRRSSIGSRSCNPSTIATEVWSPPSLVDL